MLRSSFVGFIFLAFSFTLEPANAALLDFFKRGVNYEKLKPAVEQSLLNPEEFLRDYTDNGFVYFGTTIRNAMTFPEKGLPMGSRPSYGPGLYTTNFRDAVQLAHSYGRKEGMVVELKFVKSPRILQPTQTLLQDSQYVKLLKSVPSHNDAILDLAKNFQLDGIIVDGRIVMILDQNAVARPRSLADLAHPLVKRAQKDDVPYFRSAELALDAYRVLYASASNKSDWPTPESIQQKTVTNFPTSLCSDDLQKAFAARP
jgi:hypothetical protein